MLEMSGLNRFRVRTKSVVIAILMYHIKVDQRFVYLFIYVSPAYFYAIRNFLTILHCFFTYRSLIKKIYKFIVQHNFIMKKYLIKEYMS